MTEWQGFELPDGSLIRYRDNGDERIGSIFTNMYHQKQFLDINPKAKMSNWNISQWEMYSIATEADAMLYLLENV